MKVSVNCAFGEMVSIKEIKPHPKNPNRHPEKQIVMLAELIKHHGWRSPITVSKLSGFVVRGHGRLEAAKMLGLSKVPVDFQDYSNELSEIADLIADNRVQDYSELDMDEVRTLLDEFEGAEFPMELTGFDLDAFVSDEGEVVEEDMLGQDFELPSGEIEEKKAYVKISILCEEGLRLEVKRRLEKLASEYGAGEIRVMK